MNLQSFVDEVMKIADIAPPSPTRPQPMKAIAKPPALPRPGGVATKAVANPMENALFSGMRGAPNPFVGILKNAALGAATMLPKATPQAMKHPLLSAGMMSHELRPSLPGHIPDDASALARITPHPSIPPMVTPSTATTPAPGSERSMSMAQTVAPRRKVAEAIKKIAAGFTLSAEQRANLPKEDFAVGSKKSNTGKEAYPIPDRRHAGIALGLARMHGDTADYQAVRTKVKAKYPDMLEAHDKRHEMKKAASRATELAGLGTLAVPSMDELQAHLRARAAGDKSKGAVEKRELLPHAAKPVAEVLGLGTLAYPYLSGHA